MTIDCWDGLENATEAEEEKAYKDYADLMVTFVVESHNMILERLSGRRHDGFVTSQLLL